MTDVLCVDNFGVEGRGCEIRDVVLSITSVPYDILLCRSVDRR